MIFTDLGLIESDTDWMIFVKWVSDCQWKQSRTFGTAQLLAALFFNFTFTPPTCERTLQ